MRGHWHRMSETWEMGRVCFLRHLAPQEYSTVFAVNILLAKDTVFVLLIRTNSLPTSRLAGWVAYTRPFAKRSAASTHSQKG
jgi:hypothetical protein